MHVTSSVYSQSGRTIVVRKVRAHATSYSFDSWYGALWRRAGRRLFQKSYFRHATSFTVIIQTEHMSSFCEEFGLILSCQEFQLDYFSNWRLLVPKLFGFPDNPGSEDMRACMYPVNESCTHSSESVTCGHDFNRKWDEKPNENLDNC